MTAARLLEHFGRVSEAPGAVPRLRRLILELAVRGKLLDQDTRDEPTAQLLQRLRDAKKVVEVRPRRQETHEEPTPAPAELPPSWLWAPFDAVATIQSNLVNPNDYPDFPHIAPDNIESRSGRLLPYGTVKQSRVTSAKHCFSAGAILYSKIRPALAKAVIVDFDGLCSADMYPVLSAIDREYLHKFMLSDVFVDQSVSEANRVAMPKINQAALSKVLVPIPPLPEQQRIVAKVNELMALCDQLEAAQTERETRRDRVVAASLQRLNGSAAMPRIRDAATFHFNHLPRFTSRIEDVEKLRQTILSLAVRGRLTAQLSEDEHVGELLQSLGVDEHVVGPFPLPPSWAWTSVGSIGKARLGKMLDKAKNIGTLKPYLRNVSVRWFDFDLSDLFEMRFEDDELEEFALRGGDVLICEGGEPGRCAVWDERADGVYFQKAIHRVRFACGVAPTFFALALRESFNSGRLASHYTGIGIKHLTGRGLASVLVPLPPLSEQRRIVAKVDELMALCDRLEAQIAAGQTTSSRLLDALLHGALADVSATPVLEMR